MDTISLKEYIYKNNKVEYVLEQIGCHNIKHHCIADKDYYSCANRNGDNATAINVYNTSYLAIKNWTRESYFTERSDIIDLVEYTKECSFIEAVKYLHQILDLRYTKIAKTQSVVKKNPLAVFEKYVGYKINAQDIEYLKDSLMDCYYPLLYIGWLREGITQRTATKFGLAYSYKRNRIIIPHHHWLTGKLVGINQRTVVKDYEILGIKKYYITPNYKKHLNLYGLYENYKDIQKAGYVVVAESEKAVLKRDSLLDSTVVALSGHTISAEQVRILIGLNVEIIVALDKDIPLQETRFLCEKFYHIRNVSYIYDKWDILGEKDSPMDANNKTYSFLFKHRIKYDESEHKKYLENLKIK